MIMQRLILLVLLVGGAWGLDNGLARTPPMGWLAWERFRCQTDCKNYPDSCISEKLFMTMADKLVELGLKDVGYEYVNIDDCWLAKERDSEGRLMPDPERFPSGIKALADYMHARGLKLGIYEDFGTKTCAGYPGSEFYMQQDAKTFAEWEVDMLKFDGCNSDAKDMKYGYPVMGFYMNATGRPMLYSCSWPAYITGEGQKPDYKNIKQYCNIWRNYVDIQDSWAKVVQIMDYWGDDSGRFIEVAGPGGFNDPDMPDYKAIQNTCNMWRNYGDVTDSWPSVLSIMDFYGKDADNFSAYNVPGSWADPDMLVVGDFGLSDYQQRAQFGMWAMFAAPLFMSVDLRTIKAEDLALLKNKNVIAINQDPLGIQATKLYETPYSISVWMKPLTNNCTALAFLNRFDQGTPSHMTLTLGSLQLLNPSGYNVTEAFDNKHMGVYKPNSKLDITVDPTSILLLKLVPMK